MTDHSSACLCDECMAKFVVKMSVDAPALDHAVRAATGAQAYPRVITRVMDDGVQTKDGAA